MIQQHGPNALRCGVRCPAPENTYIKAAGFEVHGIEYHIQKFSHILVCNCCIIDFRLRFQIDFCLVQKKANCS